MEYKRYENHYCFSGKFYCSEKEYEGFLTYAQFINEHWAPSVRLDGGYAVYFSEEKQVLDYIKLMTEK